MSFGSCQSLLMGATIVAQNPSHALLVDDQPCYRFSSETLEKDFYSSYIKVLREARHSGVPCCIGEFADDFVPLIYSFSGVLPYVDATSELPSEFVVQLAECLTHITRKMGDFDSQSLFENSQLTTIVTGRTRDNGESYVYDLTFYYPLAVESRGRIENKVYPMVAEYLNSKSIKFNANFDGFKTNFYTNAIPMFGSTGDNEVAEDYIGYVAVSAQPKFELANNPQHIFPVCETALYKREIITKDDVNYWNEADLDDDIDRVKWLHVILSVRGNYQASSQKPRQDAVGSDFMTFSFNDISKDLNDKKGQYHRREVDLQIDVLERFVLGWHPFRIDQESEWKLIGEAFFNFFGGDAKGILHWETVTDQIILRRRDVLRKLGLNDDGKLLNPIRGATPEEEAELLNRTYNDEAFKVTGYLDFTERDRKQKTRKTAVPLYILEEGKSIYRKYYYSFKPGRRTYITLAQVYREDSFVEAQEWQNNWIKEAVIEARSGMDTAIAISLHRFLLLEWFCHMMQGKGMVFYRHTSHHIEVDKGQFGLKKIIVTTFRDFYTKMLFDLQTQSTRLTSGDKVQILEMIAKTEMVIAKLDSQSFKDRLVKEVAIFLNKEHSESYMDEDRELTCVNNGVIVAGIKNIVFRNGRLEDYVTKRFGTYYLDNLSETDPCVVRLMTWSKETFVANAPMIRWWWKYLASTFRGGNDDKIFPFLLGRRGNEGKSAWTNFLEMLMGQYVSNVEITYFTSAPKDSNSATPITAMIYSCHLVITEEAEDTKPIRSGPFKKKTGKDKVSKRQLFGEAAVVDLQSKFLGVGNIAPTFSRYGKAEEERFHIIPIVSQRTKEADGLSETEQYQKKMFRRDNFFDQNMQYYVSAGIWILIRYYSYYLEETLMPYPEKMVKATKQYWMDHDKFKRFTSFAVEVYDSSKEGEEGAVKKTDYVDIKTIYDLFKEWHEDEYPRDKIPNIDAVRIELREKWGKIVNDKFYGIRLLKKAKAKAKGGAIGGREREQTVDSF